MRIQLLIRKQCIHEMYWGIFFSLRQQTSVSSKGLPEVILPSMLNMKPGKQLIQICLGFFFSEKWKPIKLLKFKKKIRNQNSRNCEM